MLIIISIIIGLILAAMLPKTTFILIIYMIVAPIFVISYLLEKRKTRCPKCKKYYAMKQIRKTIRSTRESTERVEKSWYNPKTGYKEYYTDRVPATVIYYDIIEECQYCGHKRTDIKSEKVINGQY